MKELILLFLIASCAKKPAEIGCWEVVFIQGNLTGRHGLSDRTICFGSKNKIDIFRDEKLVKTGQYQRSEDGTTMHIDYSTGETEEFRNFTIDKEVMKFETSELKIVLEKQDAH